MKEKGRQEWRQSEGKMQILGPNMKGNYASGSLTLAAWRDVKAKIFFQQS